MSTAVCNLCDWSQPAPTDTAAQDLATLHVYRAHRDTWLYIVGDRPPRLSGSLS